MSTGKKSDFTLPTKELDDEKLERVHMIPTRKLHPFKNQPFKINQDEEMERMCESIKNVGTITPVLARPLAEGGYELISGHRRLAACQQLGIDKMPVIVRDMTDEEAIITMVDANLQREHILPSEKAFAYKMKLDAMNHQGITSGQVGQKWSRDAMAEIANDSSRQIQRYIRLTYLIPELLAYMDDGRMALSVGVELSYLDDDSQHTVLDAMEQEDCTPSYSQAFQMKNMYRIDRLTKDKIHELMSQEKPNQKEKVSFKTEDLRRFFPKEYTTLDIQKSIMQIVEADYRRRQRSRNRGDR